MLHCINLSCDVCAILNFSSTAIVQQRPKHPIALLSTLRTEYGAFLKCVLLPNAAPFHSNIVQPVHTVQFVLLCTAQSPSQFFCTMHSSQCTVHNVHCTVHNVQCVMHNVNVLLSSQTKIPSLQCYRAPPHLSF